MIFSPPHCAAFASALGLLPLAYTAASAEPLAVSPTAGIEIHDIDVVTEDCGSSGCGYTLISPQQVQDFLADRNGQASTKSAGRGGQGGKGGQSKGQGLALGQADNSTQVVYLDFDAAGSTFNVADFDDNILFTLPAHDFTQSERDTIEARLEADYAGFNVEFTQILPAEGEFSTLFFGCFAEPACISLNPSTGSLSILFGRADLIDFRNDLRDDTAFVDVNFWEFLAQLFPGAFERLSGLPLSELSTAIVNQGANTGGHEMGHILGFRHHDSIGAPGDGLPTTGEPQPGEFIPTYPGERNAAETVLHLMASGASVGLPIQFSANADRFFSERSTVKQAVTERGLILSEAAAKGNNGIVELRNTPVPNPLVEGENADGRLAVKSVVVEGFLERPDLSADPEVDLYGFRGEAGRFFNAEVISFSDSVFSDPVIATLTLFFVEADGSLTEVAKNEQTFEPFDPLLFDIELPATGNYVLEVSAPNFVFFEFDPTNIGIDTFPLDETGNATLRRGDYDLLVYTVEGAMGEGPSRIPGPTN